MPSISREQFWTPAPQRVFSAIDLGNAWAVIAERAWRVIDPRAERSITSPGDAIKVISYCQTFQEAANMNFTEESINSAVITELIFLCLMDKTQDSPSRLERLKLLRSMKKGYIVIEADCDLLYNYQRDHKNDEDTEVLAILSELSLYDRFIRKNAQFDIETSLDSLKEEGFNSLPKDVYLLNYLLEKCHSLEDAGKVLFLNFQANGKAYFKIIRILAQDENVNSETAYKVLEKLIIDIDKIGPYNSDDYRESLRLLREKNSNTNALNDYIDSLLEEKIED